MKLAKFLCIGHATILTIMFDSDSKVWLVVPVRQCDTDPGIIQSTDDSDL